MSSLLFVKRSNGQIINKSAGASFSMTLTGDYAVQFSLNGQGTLVSTKRGSVTENGISLGTGSLWRSRAAIEKVFDSGDDLNSVFVHPSSPSTVYVAGKTSSNWSNSGRQEANLWVLIDTGVGQATVARPIFVSGTDSLGVKGVVVDTSSDTQQSGNIFAMSDRRLSKYNNSGVLQWTFNLLESSNNSPLRAMDIDTDGNVLVGGHHATKWVDGGGTEESETANLWLISGSDGSVLSFYSTSDGDSLSQNYVNSISFSPISAVSGSGDAFYVGTTSAGLSSPELANVFRFSKSLEKDWSRYVGVSTVTSVSSGDGYVFAAFNCGVKRYNYKGGLDSQMENPKAALCPAADFVDEKDYVIYFGTAGSRFEDVVDNDFSGTADEDEVEGDAGGGTGPSDPGGGTGSGEDVVNAGICDGEIDCSSGNFFHFSLGFYTDPEHTNLIETISSADEPEKFYVDGKQMTSAGHYLCKNQDASVRFSLPKTDSRDHLFNTFLYIKIEQPQVSYFSVGFGAKANVIFIIDESGSMETEHNWLLSASGILENNLLEKGIGPNKYGLVGFGSDDYGLRVISLGENDGIDDEYPYPWGTVEQFSAAVPSLVSKGSVEDGYAAIKFAIDNFVIDDGPLLLILITDEDRDITTSDSFTSIKALVEKYNASLNVIVDATFVDSNGVSALGVTSEGSALIQSGDYFIESPGGVNTDGFGTTLNDYVSLAWSVGGAAWSLNTLRTGSSSTVFTSAFAEVKSKESIKMLVCPVGLSPSTFEAFFPREESAIIEQSVHVEDGAYDTTRPFHFRITFHSDSQYQSVFDTAFSFDDNRRFFVLPQDEVYPIPIPIGGYEMEPGSTATVQYAAEILPPEEYENQVAHTLGLGITEKPLLSGVTYYVKFERYYVDTEMFEEISRFSYIAPSVVVQTDNWRKNTDAGNWISSGQGKDDILVSDGTNQSLYPSVSGNSTGQFVMAWQDHRHSNGDWLSVDYKPSVYSAYYDSVDDIFWSSGQGHVDNQVFKLGFSPISITDNVNNFYILGRADKNIFSYKCPVKPKVQSTSSSLCITDEKFIGIDDIGRNSAHVLKARVLENDLVGSFVIDSEISVGIVNDCQVRLDVVGLPGSYGVRLRNEDSSKWSGWINIDSEFGFESRGSSGGSVPSAYSIDNNRFVVPWRLSPGSGMKRVCVQVLTFFGISPVFCVEVMANISEIDYDVEFYYDQAMTLPVPFFNGLPVVSNPPDSSGATSEERDIFVKVIFKDKERFKKIKQMSKIDWGDRK